MVNPECHNPLRDRALYLLIRSMAHHIMRISPLDRWDNPLVIAVTQHDVGMRCISVCLADMKTSGEIYARWQLRG